MLLSRGSQPSDLDTLPAAIALARSAVGRSLLHGDGREANGETNDRVLFPDRRGWDAGKESGSEGANGGQKRGAREQGRDNTRGDDTRAGPGEEEGGEGEGDGDGDGDGGRGGGVEGAEGSAPAAAERLSLDSHQLRVSAARSTSGDSGASAKAGAAGAAGAGGARGAVGVGGAVRGAGKGARREKVRRLRQCLLAVQAYLGAAVEFRDNAMAEQSRREMNRCLLLLSSSSSSPLPLPLPLPLSLPLLNASASAHAAAVHDDALLALDGGSSSSSSPSRDSGGSGSRSGGTRSSSGGQGSHAGGSHGKESSAAAASAERSSALVRLEERLGEAGRQADAVVRQSMLFSHVASTAVPAPLHCLSLRLTLAAQNASLRRSWLAPAAAPAAALQVGAKEEGDGEEGKGVDGGKDERVGRRKAGAVNGGAGEGGLDVGDRGEKEQKDGESEKDREREREREWRRRVEDPSLYHYVVITDNVLAAMVVVNSTASHARQPWRHVFHVVTDRSNHPAFTAWFSANPPARGRMAWEVLCLDDFPWLPSIPLLHHLQRPAMRDFYFRHSPVAAAAAALAPPAAASATTAAGVADRKPSGAAASAAASAAATGNVSDSNSSSSGGGSREDYGTLRFRNPKYVSLFNHLRFYLPRIFPRLHTLLFLDDDVVLQQDVSHLWQVPRGGAVNLAVPTCVGRTYHRFSSYLDFSHPLLQPHNSSSRRRIDGNSSGSSSSGGGEQWGAGVDPNGCAWAFGFNLFDLKAWRDGRYTDKYHFWLAQNENRTLWQLGTLPAGLLTFLHATRPLPRALLAASLGSRSTVPLSRVRSAAVLHYNGHAKPWLDLAFPEYAHLWWRYVPLHHPLLRACYFYPPPQAAAAAPLLPVAAAGAGGAAGAGATDTSNGGGEGWSMQ
ncbi:unnamed protein product [Closterium sp. Naga37s-1]|nr:unnamed protein product [Closterium sp. Naga37s-1]